MDTANLPMTVFMPGTRESESKISLSLRKLEDGSYLVCIWTTLEKLNAWMAARSEPMAHFEVDSSFAVYYAVQSRVIRHVIVDPRPEENPYDSSFSTDSFPTDRRIDTHSFVDVWHSLSNFYGTNGISADHLEAIRRFAVSQPDIKPSDLTNRFGAQPAEAIQRPLLDVQLKPFLKPLQTAIAKFPPPQTCEKCGEAEWTFASLSPNEKSAKWICSYCQREVVVKADDVKRRMASTGREPIPKEVQGEVWRRDGARCVQCGSQEKLEFDHMIPVAKGGSNTARNLQLLCEKCNREKSSKDPGES